MAIKDTATALEELLQQYNNTPTYTPKTDEEIRAKAEGEYKSYYDQLRLTAQQQQAQSDLALQQQAAGLQATYDKQREASLKDYAARYSQADRQMLSRGMQRSSYAAQVLANLSVQGAEAQQTIADQQAAAEGNIAAQRAQLAQQLALQLAQYDANEAADVLARIRELEDQEYERGMTSAEYHNNLSAQIYSYIQQYNANNKSGGGSSGGTKPTDTTGSGDTTTGVAGSTWDSFFNALNNSLSGGDDGIDAVTQADKPSTLSKPIILKDDRFATLA